MHGAISYATTRRRPPDPVRALPARSPRSIETAWLDRGEDDGDDSCLTPTLVLLHLPSLPRGGRRSARPRPGPATRTASPPLRATRALAAALVGVLAGAMGRLGRSAESLPRTAAPAVAVLCLGAMGAGVLSAIAWMPTPPSAEQAAAHRIPDPAPAPSAASVARAMAEVASLPPVSSPSPPRPVPQPQPLTAVLPPSVPPPAATPQRAQEERRHGKKRAYRHANVRREPPRAAREPLEPDGDEVSSVPAAPPAAPAIPPPVRRPARPAVPSADEFFTQ